jgi:hypothetical protein
VWVFDEKIFAWTAIVQPLEVKWQHEIWFRRKYPPSQNCSPQGKIVRANSLQFSPESRLDRIEDAE